MSADILDGLLIPFNLTVDLTMHGDCHAKTDMDLHASYTEALRVAALHGHAVGRAEVLKPLRDIYSRGRVTFRTNGNPDSVEVQEQEFRAAIRTGDGKDA